MLEPRYIVKFGEKLPEEALAKHGEESLNVSEFFFDTIQGEGPSLGAPAAFLRLAGCPVDCKFCDTAEVWKSSQKVKISWLYDQIEETGLLEKLVDGDEILVITGGSPLLQQKNLAILLEILSEPCFILCCLVPNQLIADFIKQQTFVVLTDKILQISIFCRQLISFLTHDGIRC